MRQLPVKTKYLVVALVIVLLVAGKGWSASPTLTNPPGEWDKTASANFNYYTQPDDDFCPEEIQEALERLELFWDFAAAPWSFPAGQKVDYYRYSSRDELKEATGRNVGGLAVLGRAVVHSSHASDVHEVAHVFSTQHINGLSSGGGIKVSKFWLEGIAMYYTWPSFYYCPEKSSVYEALLGTWYGKSVHCHAREILLQGDMPGLSEFVCGDEAFNQSCCHLTYPAAGSFVTFLLGAAHSDLAAIEKYKTFLQRTNDCRSGEELAGAFNEVFGITLEEAEEKWHDFLKDWDEKEYRCPCPAYWPGPSGHH